MQHLNEVFDSEQVYPVTNLTPKAKVPQIIHIQAPGTNDIVVRLTSSDTIGTRVKAVKPGDKAVQVFLTSMSDKGNITDFKGGLGSDPIGAINTIFDTVVDICKQYRIESILFRFPKSKMKGKDQVAQRIIKRLTKTRSGGRYTTLDEIEGLSKKFAFSLLYRKGKVIQDVPGIPNIDPDKFEKVESKVGDVYIDKETGDKVSAAEAVAQTIADEASKTTQQQVVAITKVSRRAISAALYSRMSDNIVSPETREYYMENNTSIHKADKTVKLSRMMGAVTNKNSQLPELYNTQFGESIYRYLTTSGMISVFSPDEANVVVNDIRALIKRTDNKDLQSFYVELANILSTGVMRSKSSFDRSLVADAVLSTIRPMFRLIRDSFGSQAPEWSEMTENEKDAIRAYSGSEYDRINPMLLGTRKPSEGIKTFVTNMDSAFSKGTRIKKGTLLYRGMNISRGQFIDIVREGYYYFPNYISTSAMPNIYDDYANNLDALDSDSVEITTADDAEQAPMFKTARDDMAATSVGMVISGADKVRVIIPGSESEFPNEAEVILPRGLLFKITKTLGVGENDDTLSTKRKAIMFMELVNPDQLDESAPVYDGNSLLETLSFSNMHQHLHESAQLIDKNAEDILVSMIGFDGLSDKFIK